MSELRTRFLLGPLMLLVVGGVYLLDVYQTEGRASAVVLGLLTMSAVVEYVRMFRGAGFAVSASLLLPMTFALVSSAFLFEWKSTDHELYPLVIGTLLLLFPLALRALRSDRFSSGLGPWAARCSRSSCWRGRSTLLRASPSGTWTRCCS